MENKMTIVPNHDFVIELKGGKSVSAQDKSAIIELLVVLEQKGTISSHVAMYIQQ
jgi:hypothetical protein